MTRLAGRIPAYALEVCRRLRASGHQAFLVGGAVRDLLLDRDVYDHDVATSAEPGEVSAVFGRRRTVPTGIAHGTVTVLCDDAGVRRPVEVTTFRGEGAYSDGRHPDQVVFLERIDDDLARRDFTVNALAYDPIDDRLVDPHGGLRDLAARRIRAVGDPVARFREDGLRTMRAVRFAAVLEFEVDPGTLAAIPAALDVLRLVSAERVRDELVKLLRARRPSGALERMRETGMLEVVLPELLEGVGMTQNRYHAHDVWRHTLETVDRVPAETVLRLAALLHDVAKPRCAAVRDDGERTFYHHERVGAELADAILRRLRFSNEERERVVHLVACHMIVYSPDWTDGAVRRFVRRVGPAEIEPLLALQAADIVAQGRGRDPDASVGPLRERSARALREQAALKVADLAVGGADVMAVLGVPPGPIVGRVLAALLERVTDDPSLNQRERLLAMIPPVAAEVGG